MGWVRRLLPPPASLIASFISLVAKTRRRISETVQYCSSTLDQSEFPAGGSLRSKQRSNRLDLYPHSRSPLACACTRDPQRNAQPAFSTPAHYVHLKRSDQGTGLEKR